MKIQHLNTKIWILMVIHHAKYEHGSQDVKFESGSQIAKLIYGENCSDARLKKFRGYINKNLPPYPEVKTLSLVEIKVPNSMLWMQVPLWKSLSSEIKNDSDIFNLFLQIRVSPEFDKILYTSEEKILLNDIEISTAHALSYEAPNALSAMVLLLLKAELKHDYDSINYLLNKLRTYISNCSAVYGFIDEFIMLYETIKRRFTIWLNKPHLINDSIKTKTPLNTKDLFRGECKVKRLYLKGYGLNYKLRDDSHQLCVLECYGQQYADDLSNHIKLVNNNTIISAEKLWEIAPILN